MADAPLVAFLVVLLLLLTGSLALIGLLSSGDPTGAGRPWAFAWASFLLGAALVHLGPAALEPTASALLGLPPGLFLLGSLAFAGREPSRAWWALVPAGALLRLAASLLGSVAWPVWACLLLATEGGAAVVLYRNRQPDRRLPERLLPFAMGLFAIAYASSVLQHRADGITPFSASVAVASCLLFPAQILAILDWVRRESSRLARARRTSESRFQALADLSNLVVLIIDLDHRVVEWNRTAEKIYGWAREEVLGRNYVETFLPEEVRPAIAEEIARVLAGGQAHGYENPVRTRSGERILRWNVTRLLCEGDEPQGILCLAEDVTDERRQLAEQQRLFTAVEQAGDAVVMADRRGIVVYANPAFRALVEKDTGDVIGQPVREVVQGWDNKELRADIQGHWARGEIWKGRYKTRWSDGRYFVRDATFTPVRDEHGAVAYGVAVLRDVTREQELELELARSQKLTALGTLAGGIAHDFNNLLTAVLGGAHLLLEEQTPEETRRTAEQILEAARRGASLARQLLAFSRRHPQRPEVINLGDVVRDMKGLLERLIGEHIELKTRSQDGGWPILADRSQVEQVIMNLVLNARDAMPGGGRLNLDISNRHFEERDADRPVALAPGEYVSLCVIDTGVGMDERTRARAFEPFFTRKPPGTGTGLGLSTVFGIVRQSGGDVTLRSTPGQGSRVEVHLPRAHGAIVSKAPQERPGELGGDETILLVEDDAMVRGIARRTLEELGYRVLEAPNAEQARERVEETSAVDLLVTDIVMPGINGSDLAQQLKRAHPDTRVLFISGYGAQATGAPLEPLLEKPFTPEQLAQKVREVLGLRAAPAARGGAAASQKRFAAARQQGIRPDDGHGA